MVFWVLQIELNFYDFLECSLSPQKKPNYIENLSKFVQYLTKAKIPSSYVSNRYIKQMILLENEKDPQEIGNESDSDMEQDSRDIKPDISETEVPQREKSFLERILPQVKWMTQPPNPPPNDEREDDFD